MSAAGTATRPARQRYKRRQTTPTDDDDRRQHAKQYWPIRRACNNVRNISLGLSYFVSVRGAKCELLRSVCPSVCLSTHISQKSRHQISPNFLCMLPLAVARSPAGFTGWRHVSHNIAQMGQYQRRRVCFVHFARWQHRAKSAVSDCYMFLLLENSRSAGNLPYTVVMENYE